MKNKLLIAITCVALLSDVLMAQNKFIEDTSQTSIKNVINDSMTDLKKSNIEHVNLTRVPEEMHENENIETIVAGLKYATFIVDALVLLVAGFTIYITVFEVKKIESAENDVRRLESEIKEKIKESDIKMEKLEKRSEEILNRSSSELDKKMKLFTESFEEKLKLLSENYEKVNVIAKELRSKQEYVSQGLQGFNDFIYFYLDKKNEKDFMDHLEIISALVNLRSFDSKIRFAGIASLLAKGKASDIKHLQKIIHDKDETKANIDNAVKAISEINKRSKV